MMMKKSERNKSIYRSDNSYQLLLQVEDICHKLRSKGYEKAKITKAIELLNNVKTLEEK